ncbi:MAG: ABC transporter permease [Phycisphaeraceae bacterium]|nr:MAG: ABC transporter permease [Phycisphaeraceae bacterium]
MNPSKVMRIAGREFAATVLTKGFIIAALVMPVIIGAVMPLVVIMMEHAKPPADRGELAVIDKTGEVYPLVVDRLKPERIVEARQEQAKAITEYVKGMLPEQLKDKAGEQLDQLTSQQLDSVYEQFGVPQLRVIELPPDTDVEGEQAKLRAQIGQAAQTERGADRGLLAVAVVDANAVKPTGGDNYGSFDLYTVPKLDDRTIDEIRSAMRWSILERRYEASGLDRSRIDAMTNVAYRGTQEVTETGTRESSLELNMLLPGAFMILMLMGTMTGGQYLLTTTIEEKSSRVVELLLSAVSSVELMTGKIVGQMAVGLTLLLVYNAVGIIALFAFQRADLIAGSTIAWMLVLFALAYFMFASIMAAIGSAVNELREAQALMTPVMLFVMVPYFFFMPITRDPGSTLAVVTSFIPPISPFILMMRIASTTPPPLWQVLAGVAVNVVGVVVFVWLAAKVFRVGLLMFGKPPNLATLVKWVRMA